MDEELKMILAGTPKHRSSTSARDYWGAGCSGLDNMLCFGGGGFSTPELWCQLQDVTAEVRETFLFDEQTGSRRSSVQQAAS